MVRLRSLHGLATHPGEARTGDRSDLKSLGCLRLALLDVVHLLREKHRLLERCFRSRLDDTEDNTLVFVRRQVVLRHVPEKVEKHPQNHRSTEDNPSHAQGSIKKSLIAFSE